MATREDYLLRLIRQFGEVWARFVAQLRADLFPSARATLDQAYRQLLGLIPEEAQRLSANELLARVRFGVSHEAGRQRSLVLAALLAAEGDLATRQHTDDIAADFRQRALDLMLLDSEQHTGGLPPYAPSVEQLVADLRSYHLPATTLQLLMRYYEQRGAYAQAEDCLFEWLVAQPEHARLMGEAFYQRLGTLSDAQLAAGDFSRQEVAAGQAELRRRAHAD